MTPADYEAMKHVRKIWDAKIAMLGLNFYVVQLTIDLSNTQTYHIQDILCRISWLLSCVGLWVGVRVLFLSCVLVCFFFLMKTEMNVRQSFEWKICS